MHLGDEDARVTLAALNGDAALHADATNETVILLDSNPNGVFERSSVSLEINSLGVNEVNEAKCDGLFWCHAAMSVSIF